MNEPLLEVRGLSVAYGAHPALRAVDLQVRAGEVVGLVGESGAGKSTLARAVLGLVRADSGSVRWRGQELARASRHAWRAARREVQIVFQDPLASLDPRQTVGEILAEPLAVHEPRLGAGARARRVAAMLERVGLPADAATRRPHDFSGGQCQRIAVARAMMLAPALLVCDEPVSALDVSIQGQIVNLLLDLKAQTGAALLFISHNLPVVRQISDRVCVLYGGRVVENAPCEELFASPRHPYTRELLAAAPDPLVALARRELVYP